MDSGDPFGERDGPEGPRKRGVGVALLALGLVTAGALGYAHWDEVKKDEREKRELDEGICDLLVDSGNVYRDFEDCMRHR